MAILRQYALADSGNERGAAQHRCDFKLIDKARGTAAGYIAKYVAKNIDGEHVGEDLERPPQRRVPSVLRPGALTGISAVSTDRRPVRDGVARVATDTRAAG